MYEILGLKHVFSTFQETVWSHINWHDKELNWIVHSSLILLNFFLSPSIWLYEKNLYLRYGIFFLGFMYSSNFAITGSSFIASAASAKVNV